jgi:hypothetical protein
MGQTGSFSTICSRIHGRIKVVQVKDIVLETFACENDCKVTSVHSASGPRNAKLLAEFNPADTLWTSKLGSVTHGSDLSRSCYLFWVSSEASTLKPLEVDRPKKNRKDNSKISNDVLFIIGIIPRSVFKVKSILDVTYSSLLFCRSLSADHCIL